jgi:hypothetical protein
MSIIFETICQKYIVAQNGKELGVFETKEEAIEFWQRYKTYLTDTSGGSGGVGSSFIAVGRGTTISVEPLNLNEPIVVDIKTVKKVEPIVLTAQVYQKEIPITGKVTKKAKVALKAFKKMQGIAKKQEKREVTEYLKRPQTLKLKKKGGRPKGSKNKPKK